MEKIKRLKKFLKEKKIDGYIIPKNDEFFLEYVAEEKDRLKYISNFTGSYGLALILNTHNYLFVDGRYTLQAKIQCGKYFKIRTIPKALPGNVLKNKNLKIGYDPSLFTKKNFRILFNNAKCKFIPISENIVDKIWKTKKIEKRGKFYILPNSSVGQSVFTKLNKVASFIKKNGADFQLITSSENNAWLLNIRGNDSNYTPVPKSYILIDKFKNLNFFCDLNKISKTFQRKFKKINFIDIKFTHSIISKIKNKRFIIDDNTCSIFFENNILKNNSIIKKSDLIYLSKSIKTKNEIKNIQKAHIFDGVALTKYLFWLKNNYTKKNVTEISAAKKLFNFRKENKNFKFSSFPTISGTGPNGSIVHYNATKSTNRRLKRGEIYLIDSGGQYNFGTTDVTRTISLNNNNKRIKNIFTRVLKGHIAVANYKLRKKTSGSEIDRVARKYLKQIKLDYPHGTGHGVGYFLNVHEGPHAISKNNKINFKPGMIVSNEPGYYENNKFGIRIENLIYVKKDNNKLCFDNLTIAPIDKNLIDSSILTKVEKKWLNSYHKKVHKKLKFFMNKKESYDLKLACSAI